MRLWEGRTELQRWKLHQIDECIKRHGIEDPVDAKALYALYLSTLPADEPAYKAHVSPDAFFAHYAFLRRHWGLTLHNPMGPH